PRIRCQRAGNQPTRIRSVTRNHMPADAALQIAARMLIRTATVDASGRIENVRPRMTNSGFPGGWGSPNVYAAAMYSLVSHIAVEGDRVTRYRISAPSDTPSAARYEGRESSSGEEGEDI